MEISTQRKITAGFESRQHLGILLLRIFLGTRLMYGVLDNVLNWDRMLEFSTFLDSNGFIFPLVGAVVSVYVQFFGALSLLLGFKVRFFSFLLILNFLVALWFVHIANNDTIEGMTPALAMLFGSLTIFFTGAGKFSIGYYFTGRKSFGKFPEQEN